MITIFAHRYDAGARLAMLVLGIAVVGAGRLDGHEVDQYSVPVGEQLVDQGQYWNDLLWGAVQKAVQQTNEDIEAARGTALAELRATRLAHLQSPETLTFRVRQNLPTALMAIEALEMKMRLSGRRDPATGNLLAYRAPIHQTTYSHLPVLPDPRQINRIFFMRCSTIKVHNHYIGTDKIGHFVSMGYLYYQAYRAALATGKTHEEALASAGYFGKWNPLSEGGLLGMIPTGVYSNADQVANYVGMKFYLNVTRSVRLKGKSYPAMVMRCGDFWKLRPHVRPDNTFFALFLSDHLDEVLNPSLFEVGMRGPIRQTVRGRSTQLLDWYAGTDPQKRNRAYFDRILNECMTYYGEPYGHTGDVDKLVTMGQVCFEDERGCSFVPAATVATAPSPRTDTTPVAAVPAVRAASSPAIAIDPDASTTSRLKVDGAAIAVRAGGPKSSYVDQNGEYSVLVTNHGRQPEENILVTIAIPAGIHVTSIDRPAEYDETQDRLTWRLPRLAPGSSDVLRFQARGARPGRGACRILVSSDSTTPISTDLAMVFEQLPATNPASVANGPSARRDCARPATYVLQSR